MTGKDKDTNFPVMTFNPQHMGLYFNETQRQYARQHREDDDLISGAWRWLLANPGDVIGERNTPDGETVPRHRAKLKGVSAAQADAFRYCFADDHEAGTRVLRYLQQESSLAPRTQVLDTLLHLAAVMQTFELVRDHPDAEAVLSGWLDALADALEEVLLNPATNPLEQFWQMALRVTGGVVLDDEVLFSAGVEAFKQHINAEIHPEGYLRSLTDVPEKLSFHWHTLGVAALTLAAEAATQAGTDLWAYENRGVGVTTAAAYLVYYYFYPAKWRWDSGLSEANTFTIFERYGAWMEIVTYRGYPRGVELLLDQQRPFYSAYTGGLTTLTHPQTKEKKRRGWFS